jgi:hypothetical protein
MHSPLRLPRLAPFLIPALLAACDSQPATPDAFAAADAFTAADAAAVVDAGSPPADDASTPGPDAPPVGGTNVPMTYRTGTGTFDRAFMGYVSETVGGPPTGLYFELSRGADDACPSETSPVPQQILTVDGFASVVPGAQESGLEVRFFDFEGIFRSEIAPDTASAARVEITAIDLGAGTAEGSVAFTFADGSASGTFRATHCASLDSPMP